MSSGKQLLAAAWREFVFFSGLARLREGRSGGTGAILRFQRVRPPQPGQFQPLKSGDITPEFLDLVVRALRRWKFDVVSMDELCRRARQPKAGGRFVALTFDSGYRDVLTHGYPILARCDVPFTVYIPTAFPDGLGEAWWLALQEVIARHDRISLVMEGQERHFSCARIPEKYELYGFLTKWMQSLAPSGLSAAINDLCKRYSVGMAALSREASMSWDDIAKLAADPRVTIGSATVNYPTLVALTDDAARREIAMGKAVAEAAIGCELQHFAYPFGQRGSFNAQHGLMAEQAGFASAVSGISGVIPGNGQSNLYALPRICWDGRRSSLRIMRAMLAGKPWIGGNGNS